MIPTAFVERFLWPPQRPATDGQEPSSGVNAQLDDAQLEGNQPAFHLTKGIKRTLDSLVALAFSEAEKPRSDSGTFSEIPIEKCLVLSCPTEEGTHIIDAAVKHAANKQGAEVLVLDALELAAGKLGSLGEGGQALDDLYSFSSDSSNSGDDSDEEDGKSGGNGQMFKLQMAWALIDTLLSLPALPREDAGQGSQRPARRIVYLRDFQYIAKAAKPLVTYMLQSLHEARTGEAPRPTTILAFGSTNDSESLEIGDTPTSGEDNCLLLNSLFVHARARVVNAPARKSKSDDSETESRVVINGADTPPSPGFASFLMKMANHVSEKRKFGDNFAPISYHAGWGKKVDGLAKEKLSISVFAENIQANAKDDGWQRISKRKKIARLNQLLLSACLEKEGCLVEGDQDLIDSVLEGQADKLLEADHAKSIVTIARGLAADDSRVSSGKLPENVSPLKRGLVSEAHQTFKRQRKERSQWESGKSSDEDIEEDNYDDLKGYPKMLLSCLVKKDDISTSFSDVMVDPAIVDSLKTIVTLPLLYPEYFKDGVLSKEAIGGILLYGPPGTGKTMLCRALAKSTATRMLHIKPSDINDKCVGESEKRVDAVFKLARRLSPCIIFIDEIDSLFSSRDEHTRTWERNILTEFMQGMDGLQSAKENKDNRIVVVGATNRPYDLDLAVLRRMPRRILVDMPDLSMRKAILESYFKSETLDKEVDLDQLASRTDGLSGSDLKNLCVAAAMNSVKEAIGAAWSNTSSSAPTDPANHSSKVRKIKNNHIEQARSEIPQSTVLNKWEDELYKWHEKYTSGGKFSEGKHGKYGGAAGASTAGKSHAGGYGSRAGYNSSYHQPMYPGDGMGSTRMGGMGSGMGGMGSGMGGMGMSGMGAKGMGSSAGMGSDVYSKFAGGGDTATGRGIGRTGMMSKGGLDSDLYSSMYGGGDHATASGSGLHGMRAKGGFNSDFYSKYGADGDGPSVSGSGYNGMSKGGLGSDLFSSKFGTDGDSCGMMGKGGLGGDFHPPRFAGDGDNAMGKGKGVGGMMGGLGPDFYASLGLGNPGMNGHWNRWAKGGAEESEPRIQTLDSCESSC